MKSVLISIQPYYVFLIIARLMGWDIPQEKKVEVRKDFPKDSAWNKRVHIYCSKNRKSFTRIPKQYQPFMEKLLGKVIGEFVCDRVYVMQNHFEKLSDACISLKEFYEYEKNSTVYGWHISDIKIYDNPKELGEFYLSNPNIQCEYRQRGYNMDFCTAFENGSRFCKQLNCDKKRLSRPPQSWCYVEEL